MTLDRNLQLNQQIMEHKSTKGKGKVNAGTEGSRRLRLPDFKIIGTWR